MMTTDYIERDFYLYDNNEVEHAEITGGTPEAGYQHEYIQEPMLELVCKFTANEVTLAIESENYMRFDTFAIGNTNACEFTLTPVNCLPDLIPLPESLALSSQNPLYVHNFPGKDLYQCKKLLLHLQAESPVYIGYIYLGVKTCLPRNTPGSTNDVTLTSTANRSMGGQVFGLDQITLKKFSFNFPWLEHEDKEIIEKYVNTNLNLTPHILDPYPQARDKFPPQYVTLDMDSISLTRREEPFVYTGSLSWMEAK